MLGQKLRILMIIYVLERINILITRDIAIL